MNAANIAVWVEIVASIAVLITLVLLNVQIKQTNSLMRSEARQAQLVIDQEHIAKFIDHPDLAAAYASRERLDHDDMTRLWFCRCVHVSTNGSSINMAHPIRHHGIPARGPYPSHWVRTERADTGLLQGDSSILASSSWWTG